MFEYIHIYFWIGCGVGRGKEVGKAEAFQNLRLDLLQSYLFVNFVFIKFLFYFIYICMYFFFDIDLKLYWWDDIFWFCFLLQLFAYFFFLNKREGEFVGVCDQYTNPKPFKLHLVHCIIPHIWLQNWGAVRLWFYPNRTTICRAKNSLKPHRIASLTPLVDVMSKC